MTSLSPCYSSYPPPSVPRPQQRGWRGAHLPSCRRFGSRCSQQRVCKSPRSSWLIACLHSLIRSLEGNGMRYEGKSSKHSSAFGECAIFFKCGAAVAERLDYSPPTKANRDQSPAGSPDSRMWESCRTMQLVGGFSRVSSVSPALSFRRCSILTTVTLIGSQDLAKSSPNLFTHSFRCAIGGCLLQNWFKADSHPLSWIYTALNVEVLRADEGEAEWIWSSARLKELGKQQIPENSSGIVLHDFYTWLSFVCVNWRDSDKWRSHRKLMQPTFSVSMLEQFVIAFHESSQRLVHKFRHTSGPVNITSFINNTVLEVLNGKLCRSYVQLHHRGSKLEPRSDLSLTQKTVAPFYFRAGLEIEVKLISNHRNWRFEISIRDQQPSLTNFTRYHGSKYRNAFRYLSSSPGNALRVDLKCCNDATGKVTATYRALRPWLMINWIYNLTDIARRELENQNSLFNFTRKRGGYGAALDCKGTRNWSSPINPPTSGIIRHDSLMRKSTSGPQGSGSGSSRWEASGLTATPLCRPSNGLTERRTRDRSPLSVRGDIQATSSQPTAMFRKFGALSLYILLAHSLCRFTHSL
ncbi:hypothetical protein PR048_002517 [Dryococelus australis]|uniref:Uncharacterized protein n=1 Tax=Dryococelus australis TaxID=614101 RepID=A0ABQ9ILG4_9NEOP|nr:hypothetical protein PR048_002517 [Dryococelus australis]